MSIRPLESSNNAARVFWGSRRLRAWLINPIVRISTVKGKRTDTYSFYHYDQKIQKTEKKKNSHKLEGKRMYLRSCSSWAAMLTLLTPLCSSFHVRSTLPAFLFSWESSSKYLSKDSTKYNVYSYTILYTNTYTGPGKSYGQPLHFYHIVLELQAFLWHFRI